MAALLPVLAVFHMVLRGVVILGLGGAICGIGGWVSWDGGLLSSLCGMGGCCFH